MCKSFINLSLSMFLKLQYGGVGIKFRPSPRSDLRNLGQSFGLVHRLWKATFNGREKYSAIGMSRRIFFAC